MDDLDVWYNLLVILVEYHEVGILLIEIVEPDLTFTKVQHYRRTKHTILAAVET